MRLNIRHRILPILLMLLLVALELVREGPEKAVAVADDGLHLDPLHPKLALKTVAVLFLADFVVS